MNHFIGAAVGVTLGVLLGGSVVAQKEDRPKQITNSIGMTFVYIPPGSFMMGSPSDEKQRNPSEAQHSVKLTRCFYMGAYAVTQEQWQELMGKNPSSWQGDKKLPVNWVSWDDCQEFCKRMKAKDKKAYRLPTEAEWEYACRAGTQTPFHTGEQLYSDQANINGSLQTKDGKKGIARAKILPVGSFPANAWGLYDMHGNVEQWCQDWFADYPPGAATDPQGPSEGKRRVRRGGGFGGYPYHCRSAHRNSDAPDTCADDLGFRVCFFPE